ncbi:Oidioi.mRNA.OKI2018_I69.chr1.g549.t1.cds [Oikopleura dioica]|uniref:Oidioi.mRNA.OKI2018_I69.chr1.g549.t1.cds n=1 Tax=Oikopleura dioica TaxID=34765 RepID=A0ABN7SQ81_OIKDI|nr:Oidioi.mRNA.OKI2018_I69.chr1.g549.t1.cds [Oikopleura dioica]
MSFEIWREFVENANRSVRKKNFSESGPASRRRLRRNWGDKEEYLKEPERRSRGAEDTGRCQNNAERGSDTMHSQRTTRDLINNYANISDLVNRMMNRRKSELFQKYNIDLKVKQEPPRQFWSTENLSPELDEKIEQQNVRLVRERSLERPGNPVSKSTSFLDKEKDPTKTKFRVRLRKKAPKKPDSARQRKRLVVVSKPFRTNLPDEIFPRKMTPEAVPTSPMVIKNHLPTRKSPTFSSTPVFLPVQQIINFSETNFHQATEIARRKGSINFIKPYLHLLFEIQIREKVLLKI